MIMSLLWIKFNLVRHLFFAYTQRVVAFLVGMPVPPKISSMGIIENNGKFLVLDLTYRDGYAFPGGLTEAHESLEESLAREIKEETGLTMIGCRYVCSKEAVQYGISVVVAAFVVTAKGDLQDSSEGSLHWKTADEIIGHCAYQNSEQAFIMYLKQHEGDRG